MSEIADRSRQPQHIQKFLDELDAILDDPYVDGENVDEMTPEQLRDFARRRLEQSRTEPERWQALRGNEILVMLAEAKEATGH